MRFFTFLVGTLLAFSSMGFAQNTTTAPHPLQVPELTTFVELVNAAGIMELFQGTGPFTVFPPTNEAFMKMNPRKFKDLLKPESHDQLVSFLLYYVVPGKYMSNTLQTTSLKTISGKYLNIRVEGGQIKVNNANVIRRDIVGPNAVFHIIDTVQFQ